MGLKKKKKGNSFMHKKSWQGRNEAWRHGRAPKKIYLQISKDFSPAPQTSHYPRIHFLNDEV